MTYTTSMGSYIYTLMPDGSITANGGLARATRIGRAPPAVGPKNDPSAKITASRSTPDATQNQTQPKAVKDCSGVSGKINGVELKPTKCDDPPAKAVVPPPSPKSQLAKASTPASGTLSGSQRALDAVADISPEFKSALENAALSLGRPNVDPSRFSVRSKESEPAPPASRTQLPPTAVKSDENSPEEAIFSPDSDPDDYAKKCRDELFGSGLKSLAQDIKAARKGPKRDTKFYIGKVKLVNKVLKKCINNVLDREIIEPLKQSGILEELAGDTP